MIDWLIDPGCLILIEIILNQNLIEWLNDWMIKWLIDSLIDWLFDVGYSFWSLGSAWFIDWLIDCSVTFQPFIFRIFILYLFIPLPALQYSKECPYWAQASFGYRLWPSLIWYGETSYNSEHDGTTISWIAQGRNISTTYLHLRCAACTGLTRAKISGTGFPTPCTTSAVVLALVGYDWSVGPFWSPYFHVINILLTCY